MIAGAAAHEVDTAVTDEDRAYGARVLANAGYAAENDDQDLHGSFDAQVETILAVQDAVLKATPDGTGLPQGQPREPKDVFIAGQGLCFDRSRAIEKILSGLGFETRHLAIYSTAEHGLLRALVTPGTASHALTEVRTLRGWMLVDSNARWIGLGPDGAVHGIEAIQARDPFRTEWAAIVPEPASWPLFSEPFTYVIGLYSRHGKFFPPYNQVPDVNYAQLLQNF
ncbi:MAG: hypothetical protein OEN23_16565 [Paracoccaceae bacterium]|nr:hypothetical protein [Paracoccaceae bacterium]